jgi:hypothetical protein
MPVEDMFVVNDSMRYSEEEEEEPRLRSGLTAGEGEVGEVGVCASIESTGVSELLGVCASIESTDVSELLDVCTSIGSTGVSKFLDAASTVEKFTVFVFLGLLCVVREVLTEGRRDRVWVKRHLAV